SYVNKGEPIHDDTLTYIQKLKEAGIPSEEVFVIGGGEVYKLLLPYCDTLYITRVQDDAVGDVSFPEIPNDFTLIKGEMRESGGYHYSFDTYVRQHP
ncbi:MAG: dihydrofolate reductase, partial [Clostridia bacterium]|nr:dihydrofolate reductase [Clostridia bacterium]